MADGSIEVRCYDECGTLVLRYCYATAHEATQCYMEMGRQLELFHERNAAGNVVRFPACGGHG
ncbi:MAG: hypothetical protein AAFQ67_00760 [Pseudomonadota bacterium]